MKKALTRDQIRQRLNSLAVMRDVKINKTTNPTVPAILRKILHPKRRCEDCPRTVKNRVVEAHVVFYPIRHWLQQCNKCDAFLCHRTGRYQLSWQQAHNQTLTDIGYHKMVSNASDNKNLTKEQQRDLQKYRNQLQSIKLNLSRIKKKRENTKSDK